MQIERKCCPNGSWPALVVKNYHDKGKVISEDKVSYYHSGEGEKALVMVSDIFGCHSARHHAVADTYAELGYDVYVPALLDNPYNGIDVDVNSIIEWLLKQDFQKTRQHFANFVQLLHKKGIKSFFVVGFCWGVFAAFRFATQFDQITSIAGFHPSLEAEEVLGGSMLALTQKIKCPAFLYPAQQDSVHVKEGGEVIKILQEKFGADKVGSITFTDMLHGWVSRGGVEDEKVCRDVQRAITYSNEYFNKFEKCFLAKWFS